MEGWIKCALNPDRYWNGENKCQTINKRLRMCVFLQRESSDLDVIMNEDEDDDDKEKQPSHAQVSHQDVWDLFENIWSKVFQTRWVRRSFVEIITQKNKTLRRSFMRKAASIMFYFPFPFGHSHLCS